MKLPHPTPPRLAERFLRWFLRDELSEEVLGDLEEKFYRNAERKSLRSARLDYWYQTIHYLRPFALRSPLKIKLISTVMLYSYYTIAMRNALRQKLYSFINIAGLTIGLTCFLMMMLYVQHEFSYNKFYKDADQIYRVYQRQEGNVFLGSDYFSSMPAQLPSVMKNEFPEVIHATSVEESHGLISYDDNHWHEKGLAGDEDFFNVFEMSFISGNAKTALREPKSIVFTESLAHKLFGTNDVVGRTISYQEEDGYLITAVIDDAPAASSLKYDFVINIRYNKFWMEENEKSTFNFNSFYAFFKLRKGSNAKEIEAKFPELIRKYKSAQGDLTETYLVHPLTEMYFQSNINFDIGLKGNKNIVYVFSSIAILVLLLACVNYMNLAIARSIRRSKEVGLRKVVGAHKTQLMFQFLSESIFTSLIALVLAIGITYLFLPQLAQLIERPLALNMLSIPWLLPSLFVLLFLVGFLSGSYPALLMSSLRPVHVLKANTIIKLSGFNLQQTLLVAQFTVSIVLVIASIVIYQQLQFIGNKELGFDKENIITIQLKDRSLREKYQTLSERWSQQPRIMGSTLSSSLPINITSSTTARQRPGDQDRLTIYQVTAEHGFTDVFGMEVVAGREFSKDDKGDIDQSLIINETAVKALGWTSSDAIGRELYIGDFAARVIGVVKDFHMHSIHLPIQPLMIRLSENRGNHISIKISPEEFSETIAYIERSFRDVSSYPFQYNFLESDYENLYHSEKKIGEIFSVFTVVAILIASLGLFGLAAFFCDQRTKEIGIRKVLGASAHNIAFLLSRNFFVLVFISFIIAAPIGWYVTKEWLASFAYRVDVSWWVFAVAGLIALGIAKFSVGYQSFKASVANPVDSLRSE